MQPERLGLGVGILVDEDRDAETAAMFERRRALPDHRAAPTVASPLSAE
jgi:hypothetical protein